MELLLEHPVELETEDEKMSSLLHSALQSRLAFLFNLAYRNEFNIFTELDLDFASGKTRPDLCVFPKRTLDWMEDEIVVSDVPLTTIEILSPQQSLHDLIDRVYKKHFPAGVKTVWIVVPPIEVVTIFRADRRLFNFTEGTVTDPVTGLHLAHAEVFEG